ncbi:MAG: TPM domain-containing protein [Verrucomicrobiota bacterium JB023]|nr:TPM domain-containing protein [Verrucomicrobiota bacterium JB023]
MARRVLGPIPALHPGVTDLSEALKPTEIAKLKKRIDALHQDFPQCRLHLVLNHFDSRFPLSTHLFWLFNAGGLSPEENRLGRNRDLLIGLDPGQGRIALICGYGLEPLIDEAKLDAILLQSKGLLTDGSYGVALLQVIANLHAYLGALQKEVSHLLANQIDSTSHGQATYLD